MTRTMWDSTNPFDIPETADLVMGYVDGDFAWSGEGWNRFAHADKVRLATRPTTIADGLDVENGDANPQDIPGWLDLVRGANIGAPFAYCQEANWNACKLACALAHIVPPLWLIAAWDDVHQDHDQTIPDGAIGRQYAHPPFSGGHYDLSAVVDGWPPGGMMQLAAPIVRVLYTPTQGGYFLVGADGGVFAFGDADEGATKSLPALGVKLGPGQNIVDAEITPSGKGLLLAGADGGVFALGDAPFFGSIPGLDPSHPSGIFARLVGKITGHA